MPASYTLIADTDGDRIARTVRECVEVLPARLVIARDGDDAIRMLGQFGPPALLVASLSLPGKDGLAVIDALRKIDEAAAVIAFAGDREMREYATSQVANARTRVLGRDASSAVLRRCLEALLPRPASVPHDEPSVPTDARPDEENWSAFAARAQRALGVAGTAVYEKAGGTAKYRLSVVWTSDAPMPSIPEILPGIIEEVVADGTPRIWPDIADEPKFGMAGSALYTSVRSLAIIPIRRGGETVGALCAFDSRPQAIRASDLDKVLPMTGSAPPAPVARRGVASPPIDREAMRSVIPREVARVRREKQSLSLILFSASQRRQNDAEAAGSRAAVSDLLAQAVRGNDLVVRWTDSEVLLVLTGVTGSVARLIAERVREIVETTTANRVAVSGAVTELRTTDSFEATVARVEERLHAVREGDPRIA